MKTRITIEHWYPIFKEEWPGFADGDLAGAVSKSWWSQGIIGGWGAPKEIRLYRWIRHLRTNLLVLTSCSCRLTAEDIVDLVIEEGSRWWQLVQESNDTTQFPWCRDYSYSRCSVLLCKTHGKNWWCRCSYCRRNEAGGHIGKLTTMTLVRQVAAAVQFQLSQLENCGWWRGVAAGFMLGAEAVQVGTRFVVAKESNAHQNTRKKTKARDIDTLFQLNILVMPFKKSVNTWLWWAEKDAFKQENPDLEIFEQI